LGVGLYNYSFFFFNKTTLTKLLPSHLIGSASASVISGEEQFEDYGERVDVDFTPSSPCPEDDTHTNGFSDLGSSLPSRFVAGLDIYSESHSPNCTYTHLLKHISQIMKETDR